MKRIEWYHIGIALMLVGLMLLIAAIYVDYNGWIGSSGALTAFIGMYFLDKETTQTQCCNLSKD